MKYTYPISRSGRSLSLSGRADTRPFFASHVICERNHLFFIRAGHIGKGMNARSRRAISQPPMTNKIRRGGGGGRTGTGFETSVRDIWVNKIPGGRFNAKNVVRTRAEAHTIFDEGGRNVPRGNSE